MYELVKVSNKTYYINSPSKVGMYVFDDNSVYLIDTGNDKDAGRRIKKILEENNFSIRAIINTHSNADHVGGNAYLQNEFKALTYGSKIENCVTENPIFETSILYGGYPFNDLQNKFLMATPSYSKDIEDLELEPGFEILKLDGHFVGMIGIKTPDNVYFLADSLMGENIINKYHVSFIYDLESYMRILESLGNLNGDWYVLSHAEVLNDLKPLISTNGNKINEIIDLILKSIKTKNTFEGILKEIFDYYKLSMDHNQYVLVGSTIRSYLSYLINIEKITYSFDDNKMYYSIK